MRIFAEFPCAVASKFNDSGVVDDGNLGGYFFGYVRDKASNITWRYAIPCWPVIDCKMNDLEKG